MDSYKSQSQFSIEEYKPLSVKDQMRNSILEKIHAGQEPKTIVDLDGRDEAKLDVVRALLTGSHIYLVSEEGIGKTRLANSLSGLLPTVPIIGGCVYNDDPKWSKEYLCPRCAVVENPAKEYGIDFVSGAERFSRIQGNEYSTQAKILGFKDIQEIAKGKSPSDPTAFTGTGVFRGNRGITFVDELPSIPTKVQVLFHPILEEGKAILEEYNWEHPIDTIFVATGNPEGFSHVNKIPLPLLDRLEMIRLTYPDEDIEKSIMQKQRYRNSAKKEPATLHADAMNFLNYVDSSFLERSVIVPWWLTDIINQTVRYSRHCENLDKGASIRGSIKGFDHTASSTEIRYRTVARMEDAYHGLKLAMRGRVKIRSDLIEHASEATTLTDQVVEDMMRHAAETLAGKFYDDKIKGDEILLGQIGSSTEDAWNDAVKNVQSGKYSELHRLSIEMFSDTGSRLGTGELTPLEQIFNSDYRSLGNQVLPEAFSSALEFVYNASVFKKKIKEADAVQKVFIPKRFGFNDRRKSSADED